MLESANLGKGECLFWVVGNEGDGVLRALHLYGAGIRASKSGGLLVPFRKVTSSHCTREFPLHTRQSVTEQLQNNLSPEMIMTNLTQV